MRDIYSKRKWKIVMINDGVVHQEIICLMKIYEKAEQEDDFEYNYAIQERIDDLLDMKEGEVIHFQFNRDDDNDKGIIARIK